jgi:WD40 repeat protein
MNAVSRSILVASVLLGWRCVGSAPESPQPHAAPPAGHSSLIESIAVSRDGKLIVTQSFSLAAESSQTEGTAILWDASGWKPLHTFHPASRIALSGDDRSLALTSRANDGSLDVVVWDTETLQKRHTFQVRPAAEQYNLDFSVGSIGISGDGTLIITGMGERRAILWESSTGKKLRTFEVRRDVSEGTVVAMSGDGRLALVGLQFAPSILFDTQTGKKLRTLQKAFYAKTAALSADGKLALTAGNDRAPGPVPQGAALWDTSTGRQLYSLTEPDRPMQAMSAALSADGTLAAVGNGDGTVTLWRTSDGAKLSTLLVFQGSGRNPSVRGVGLSGDGRLLVAGDGWGTITAWDTASGEHLHTFPSLAK